MRSITALPLLGLLNLLFAGTALAGTSGPVYLAKHPINDIINQGEGTSLKLDAPGHTEATVIRTRLEMNVPSSEMVSMTEATSSVRPSSGVNPTMEPWAPGKGALGIRVQITW